MKAKNICHLTTLSFNDLSTLGSSVEDSKEHKSCNVTRWGAVSFSYPSYNRILPQTIQMSSQRSKWRDDYTPTPHEWNRTSNQPRTWSNKLSNTSRDTSNHSQLLLPNRNLDYWSSLSTAGSTSKQARWRKTKNYERYYEKEDMESSNYTIRATRTRRETSCTRKSWIA